MSNFTLESSSDMFLSRNSGLTTRPVFAEGNSLLGDRYVVTDFLGGGGYGVVYRAEDRLLRRQIALKMAKVGPCDPLAARRILEHEFRVYHRVGSHPNLVAVYDMHYLPWRNAGVLIMAMEWVDGGSLRDWLQANESNREVRVRHGRKLIMQACSCLSALHRHGVAHLDIKPENLLLTRDGVLKVSDLGAAQCLNTILRSSAGARPSVLRHGTPHYMSPEQFAADDSREIGVQSDIYAVGIILYEMFSERCRPPFSGTYQELRERHLHSPAPELKGIDPRLAAIVARCLEKSVSRRSSAVELLEHSRAVGTGQWSRRPDAHVRRHQESWQRR